MSQPLTAETLEATDGVNGILKTLADATAAEYENGRTWYRTANRWARKVAALTGKRPETVAAVLARVSPQVSWADNKSAAFEICAGIIGDGSGRCYSDNVRRAEYIAAEDTDEAIALEVLPRKGYARPKISNFYRNIANPDCPNAVTVDTWAIRIWRGNCMAEANTITRAQSERIQTDYRAAASVAGLLPQELQAIVWVAAHRLAKEGLQRSLFDVGLGFRFKI